MKTRQTGVAIVEFALVAILFFTVLLAITDFGRLLFTWNAAAEATRKGARLSVVCDIGAAKVITEMQKFLPVTAANVEINWYGTNGSVSTSCDSANCIGVEVKIKDMKFTPIMPVAWIGFSYLDVPAFSTYLPREIMGKDPDSDSVCK